jgi:putative flippase GtrA
MLTPETLKRIIKFGMIGTVGFMVDAAVLWVCTKTFGLDPYTARLISYVVAATATWMGNRLFTFADRPKTSIAKQWLSFLMFNACGFVVNYSVYAMLVANIPYVYEHPVWAVAAGSLAGMTINYVASTRFIFPKN